MGVVSGCRQEEEQQLAHLYSSKRSQQGDTEVALPTADSPRCGHEADQRKGFQSPRWKKGILADQA